MHCHLCFEFQLYWQELGTRDIFNTSPTVRVTVACCCGKVVLSRICSHALLFSFVRSSLLAEIVDKICVITLPKVHPFCHLRLFQRSLGERGHFARLKSLDWCIFFFLSCWWCVPFGMMITICAPQCRLSVGQLRRLAFRLTVVGTSVVGCKLEVDRRYKRVCTDCAPLLSTWVGALCCPPMSI